jgi:Holliday junction resolvasome RuvABC endonuclease subunit
MFKIKSEEPMIIMGIDPSLSNTGITVVNRKTGELLLAKTLKFSSKDKKEFIKSVYEKGMIPIKEVDKTTPDEIRNFVNYQYAIYRIGKLFEEVEKEIIEFDVDTMVAEVQIRNVDLTQCIGYLKALAGKHNLLYSDYEPKRWKKLLTTNGDADELLLRQFVKSYFPLLEPNMDEHQIDAFTIMLTYLKQNNLSLAVKDKKAILKDYLNKTDFKLKKSSSIKLK